MRSLDDVPQVVTARLRLRGWRDADRSSFARMNADPRVSEHLVGPISRDDSDDMVDRVQTCWRKRGYGLWAAEERASGLFAGYIGFWNPDGWPGFELGWTLRRSFWGRGLATEGARAALRFAFTDMQQSDVISLIYPENAASIRVAERLGERLVEPVEVMGQTALLYRITRGEWQTRR